MFDESDKLMVSEQLFSMTILATLKFIHCEKATKFEKIFHLFLKLFLIVETKRKISKFMWPSQNIWIIRVIIFFLIDDTWMEFSMETFQILVVQAGTSSTGL